MPDADAARFELLKQELDFAQSGIRGLDSILFQVKGWTVTVGVALAGLAVTQKNVVIVALAVASTFGFLLVDAHFKSVQRVFINRARTIEGAVAGHDPYAVLANPALLKVPNLATAFSSTATGGIVARATPSILAMVREMKNPTVLSLYLVVLVLLGLQALVMQLS